MTLRKKAKAWMSAALVLVVSSVAGCSCERVDGPNGAKDSSPPIDGRVDASLDARPDAAEVSDAAPRPDAAPIWDAGPSIDAVPGSLIQLPPTGLNEMRGAHLEYPYVAYSEWRNADYDIFLFDLRSSAEIAVTDDVGDQTMPRIASGWVLWSDYRSYSPPGSTAVEIFGYEISSAIAEQITSDGFTKKLIGATVSHLLYQTDEGMPPGHGVSTLVLENRTTSEKRVLCEYIYGPQGASLSDTHVAWAALDPNNGGVNRSVFLHDIIANETRLIATTTPGDVWTTDLSNDWLVWSENRYGHYDVFAYRIATGLEQRVTDEPHDQIVARVGGHLVVFMDFRYTGGSFDNSATVNDLVVHDLETGEWRKITNWSARWAPIGPPQAGWQVYIRLTFQGASTYELWAMNLAVNQLVDGSGHVIPAP